MNQFSHSALFLRRRSVWEAADSGVLLWRLSFFHFIPFYVLPVIAAACALRLFLPGHVFFSYLALWWLKPLFDRLVLHVVSVRFFQGKAKTASLRRGLLGAFRGLFGDLLWRRFSPGRAAHMPVRILERVRGRQFHARKSTLAAGGLKFCSLMSFLGLAMEAVLLLSQIVFARMAIDLVSPAAFGYLADNTGLVEQLIFAAFCFNYILAGSLYVCMGFGLYINSRVEVEGWDLQLLFQKFAASPAPAAGKPRPELAVVLLLCLFLAVPAAAHSDTPPDAQSLDVLNEILASPDFGGVREGWEIRFRERENDRADPTPPSLEFLNWLEGLRQAFGYILRGIVVLAIAAFAGFAVYWLWKNRRKGTPAFRDKRKQYTNPLFSTESPELLFAKAEDFFRRGNLREAWATCLAASIGACAKYHALSFPPGATEYGCLALVRKALPAKAEGFRELVQSWVFLAYGERAPGEGAFEQALSYGRSLTEGP